MNKVLSSFSSLKRPFNIIVEGNIASGKTTFLDYLDKKYGNVCILAEPVESWRNCNGHNLLHMFYEDPKKWGFTFQSYVQLTLLQNHVMDTPHSVKLMERSLYSARYCFVEKMIQDGILPTASVLVLDEWFKWIMKKSNIYVDLVIYLRTTPEVAHDRIKKRNRLEEKHVPFSYINDLHELHEHWLNLKNLHSCPAPVLVLNANLDKSDILEEYSRVENILCSDFNQVLSIKPSTDLT